MKHPLRLGKRNPTINLGPLSDAVEDAGGLFEDTAGALFDEVTGGFSGIGTVANPGGGTFTGEVLDQMFGPPSTGGSGAPDFTQTELDILDEQLRLLELQGNQLEQQIAFQNNLLPVLLQPLGFEVTRDDEGNITGVQEIEKTQDEIDRETRLGELEDLRLNAEELTLERQMAALRGELPVDEALTQQLTDEEETLRNTLLQQLGPGFETSTPGIEALDKFGQRKSLILDAARRGDLTTATQLATQQGQFRLASDTQQLGNLLSTIGGAQGVAAGPMSAIGGLSNVVSGLNLPLSSFTNQRVFETQTRLAQEQIRAQLIGGIFQGGGQIAGTALLSGVFKPK